MEVTTNELKPNPTQEMMEEASGGGNNIEIDNIA